MLLDVMVDPYVFLSCAGQDKSFVEKLTEGLRSAGIQTWTFWENISAGQNWENEIEDALLHATALIYVASENSRNSPRMEKEVEVFIRKHSVLIPIIIDNSIDNMPTYLRDIQWVDFRHQFQPALLSLIGSLKKLGFRISSPVAATQAKSKGYVFISYADEDFTFVKKLKSFLKNHGYAYWDYRESNRKYQTDYTIELEIIIKDAVATLSIISPEWKLSRDAFKELHFSEEVGTPIFLIKVRDPGPTFLIAGRTYIDFSENEEDGFLKLDAEMKQRGL
jgi:hypothetical protein